MRTLGFRTHVLLVLVGAIGALAALGRPWYAPAPPPHPDNSTVFDDVHGPLYDVLQAAKRWITATGGTTGWDSLGVSGSLLAGLCLVVGLSAVGSLLPGLQGVVRDPLRYGAFAMFAICLWRLADSPGPNDALELRLGAFIAFGCSVMAWISAQGVANAPLRRRVAPPTYTPPPPPPTYEYEPGR
jgi:hypothetical protein